MHNRIGKPHRNFLYRAAATAAVTAAIWVSHSAIVPQAFAQGAPDGCLPGDAGSAGMEAYAVILDRNPSKEEALAKATAFSAKLGSEVKVFKQDDSFIVVMCGSWMDKASASAKVTEVEQSLSGMMAQVTLFQKR